MATPKGTIVMNADFEELHKAIGAVMGMTATVRTDRFLTPLAESTHAVLANQFDEHMDTISQIAPEAFHHVYEWGMVGTGTRLWKHQLKGRGSSNRLASWAWRASKVPIPTPSERAGNPNDPMSELSDEDVAKFSDRTHIFIWKAPVMEYNKTVHIAPVYAKRIAFPFNGEIVTADSTTVQNPGGAATTLAFTKAWTAWWQTTAPTVYEETIEREIKRGIEEATSAAVRKGSRKASLGLSTLSEEAAIQQGMKWAEQNLHKFADRHVFGREYEDEGDM